MKLAVLLAGGAAAIVAVAGVVGFGVYSGRLPLHHAAQSTPQPEATRSTPQPEGPQPKTQLVVRLDTAPVSQQIMRTVFEDVGGVMRETRVGFASMSPSGAGVDVTIRQVADREPAKHAIDADAEEVHRRRAQPAQVAMHDKRADLRTAVASRAPLHADDNS